jgi:hypothetical protein
LTKILNSQSSDVCLTTLNRLGQVNDLQFNDFQIVIAYDDNSILIWDFSSPISDIEYNWRNGRYNLHKIKCESGVNC